MFIDGELICREVRIENTNKCNSRCTVCPRDKMTRPLATMQQGHFCYLIEQAYRLKAHSVGIFGFGEPLLDSGIVEKVNYASRRGLETHITTNASLLDFDLSEQLLDAGLTHIRFSIHAINPKLYGNVHRGLNWFDVTKNMCNFVDLNKKLGKPCTTHITCIPQHGESVEDIREMWEPLVDYLEIWKPHNWGGKKEYRKGEPIRSCYRPFSGPLQIQADGNVIPCCFLTDGEVILGNTYNHTIKEILQGDAYQKLQRNHKTKELECLPCENCDQRFESEASPLLYSNRDPARELNKLSTSKLAINQGG
jgi:radical SAM protein with 4Fe4S-binding SPASM domain